MQSNPAGFAVIYRWRLRRGFEPSFIAAWSRLSELLLERGSLGSRLHRAEDGWWYSYAQWPSAEARRQAFAGGSPDAEASAAMSEAIEDGLPELVLEPVVDFMILPAGARRAGTPGGP